MIKKEEKQFAFVGYCIVCVCVAVGLLTLAFCVANVNAEEEECYTFEKSISATQDLAFPNVANDITGRTYYFTVLTTNEISFYESLSYVRIQMHTAHGTYNLDDGAPLGASTSFIATVGADYVGSGLISYSKIGADDYYVYVFFDDWDIGGKSGTQDIALSYDRDQLYNIAFNNGVKYATASYTNMIRLDHPRDGWPTSFTSDIYIQYGGYWRNDVCFTVLYGEIYDTNVTKSNYSSKVKIWTDLTTYIDETAFSNDDFDFNVFEEPIYINITDIWSNYHTATFVGPPAKNRLFGYAKDAAEDFVLENVFVEMTLPRENNTLNTTTASTGYYNLNNDVFEEYWLNASLSGYQNFNTTIDYTGDQRYDILLTKNETVNPGTCTVAGIVTDATSGEPILNALVWIKNTTFSSYRYTNANGYYVFYDLHNTTYTLSAEQDGYHKQQLDINLTDIDTAYYYDFALLAITDEEVPPTPTPKPPETLPEHVDNIFDMLGIEDWSVILAACVIMFMGGMFGGWSKYNPIVIMFGGFFGFLICIYMGLLPSWMLALVIVITVLLIVGVVARKYAGDE